MLALSPCLVRQVRSDAPSSCAADCPKGMGQNVLERFGPSRREARWPIQHVSRGRYELVSNMEEACSKFVTSPLGQKRS